MTALFETRAKQAHDRLVEMGGRPSRPIRLQPTWKATYRDGLIYISDNEGELDCTLSNDMDPMEHHWVEESTKFRGELEQWQIFRECQQKWQNNARLETQLELDNTDAGLMEILIRLSDWQEFEIFQKNIRGGALYFEDRCRQTYLQIREFEVSTAYPRTSSVAHEAIRTWLRQFDQSQKEIEDANKKLNWIKSQWPKVVAESVDSISKSPELQSVLEAKFKRQTHAAFAAIQKLGGQPSRAVHPPHESMNFFHRILYWTSEASKYMQELVDWETFLSWRLFELGDKPTTQEQDFECPQFQSGLDFYVEFEKFRSFQYNLASVWLQCWQRVVQWYEEEIETPDPDVPDITPGYLENYAKAARLHMRDSEQRVADAAMRLEKAAREHAHALSEPVHITGGEIKESLPTPRLPTPPPSFSESPSSSHSSLSSSSSSLSSHSTASLQSSPSVQPYPSPPSSQYSQSSKSHGRLFEKSKSSTAEKRRRRSKKEAARRREARLADTNTIQQPLPTIFPGSPQFEEDDDVQMEDDDIQMMDILEDENPAEAIEEFGRPESEDTVTTDLATSSSNISSCSSELPTGPISVYESWKLRLSGRRPHWRKVPSPTKLDQASFGGVPKPTSKKAAKKVRKLTEQQTMMLLNAVSNSDCPTDSPLPRRSERLKEKAAASAIISQLQLNAAQTPQSTDHKQPQKQAGHIEASRPSKRKYSELQLDALEPPQTTRPKNPKIQLDALEPPQTPRRKKPKIQPDAVDLPQTSKPKKPKMESKTNEPSRRQKKLERRARDAAHPRWETV